MITKKHVERFPSFAQERIGHALSQISSVLEGVKHAYDGDTLTVHGLTADAEPVVFTHGNSATAALEMFMEGYNAGYGHGVEDKPAIETRR